MRTTRRALLASGLGAGVSGCALLSTPDPVQLFRFGQSAGAGARLVSGAPRVTLLYTGTTLPRAAAGDRILTVSGADVSYIGGSRWAGPALILFEEAVLRAFESGPVRLLRRGSAARADGVLRVEVSAFEAQYATPDAAPTVVVGARALFTPAGVAAGTLHAAFESRRPASTNRVSAIAAAFDEATAEVLARTAAWVAGVARPVAA